jgi:anaerobic selenocysteine-containing dehydrogenase
MFQTAHPLTADGKIHLVPEVLGPAPYRYEPPSADGHPLALVSPATSKTVSSTLGEYNLPHLMVELHREDAAARGIADGDQVRVFNDLGEVRCRARVGTRVRAGVASMPKGAWRAASENGLTATALCPAHVSDVAGGACFNDARVEVERA